MNLLQTQDSLKNLSDQQLMTEMQNPTGQVPQFLVLSELKRRKDMRNQNQSPPSRTVAEELTEPSQAAITQPGTVPAQAMPQGAQGAGIRTLGAPGMREGGVVRMAAGERVPSPTGLDGYTEQQLRDLLSPQESVPAAPVDNAFSRFLRGGRRENLPEQQWIPINPNTQSTVFGQPPRATIERAL